MAITFKSVGHFFATVFTAVKSGITKIEGTAATVETVTAAIPVFGSLALTVEKAAYATLGEVAALLNAGDAAVAAKLGDAGLDINVIQTIEAIIASVPGLAAVAKTL